MATHIGQVIVHRREVLIVHGGIVVSSVLLAPDCGGWLVVLARDGDCILQEALAHLSG